MSIALHWFLPTNGDSRGDLSLGSPIGTHGSRAAEDGAERAPDVGYLGQIARAAESFGFDGALTPTSSWCEDAWVVTAALSQVTERLRFMVALRPGLVAPTLAAQMAATHQRVSRGRLLLNVVVGGDGLEQRRYGDRLGKEDRYARAAEFLTLLRALWSGEEVTWAGRHLAVEGAAIDPHHVWPDVYLGGSSEAAIDVAAEHADVYLTWGEPPEAVAAKLDRVRARADAVRRAAAGDLRFGIRLNVIARETSTEAWAEADRLLHGLSPDAIARAQDVQRASESEGQRRMSALHGGRTDRLEVSPNLWAGIGLVRGGAGTALVGSHREVAERIAEYHDLGVTEFILSGYPHLEEAYRVGEGVVPELRREGLLGDPRDRTPSTVPMKGVPA